MRKEDSFETAAGMIFDIVRKCVDDFPGKRRVLFLDIEGHRNSANGFDHDAFELQQNFVLDFLGPFLSEVSMPLGRLKLKEEQRDDLPLALEIFPAKESTETDRQV